MMIVYSKDDLEKIKRYKLENRAARSNARFPDKIFMIDILNALKRFSFKCVYCNEPLKKDWQLDHFHPRAMGGLNVPENLAPSCKWCNQMKNALDGNAFLLRVKKIYLTNQEVELPHPVIGNTKVRLADFPLKMPHILSKSEYQKQRDNLKMELERQGMETRADIELQRVTTSKTA